MKATYNLGQVSCSTKYQEVNFTAELKDQSITIEFSPEEYQVFIQGLIEGKKLAGEIAQKIIPLAKDAVIDLVKAVCNENLAYIEKKNAMNIVITEKA